MEALQERSGFLGHLGPESNNLGANRAPTRLARESVNQPTRTILQSQTLDENYASSSKWQSIDDKQLNLQHTYITAQIVQHQVRPEPAWLTPPGKDVGPGASSTMDSEPSPLPKPSNAIYETQLTCKGRGFPLWVPQPNMRFTPSHRAKGVSIGDVSITTEYGAVDFLFNICLAADDLINPPDLPKGFTTLNFKPWDVREFRDFPNGSYFASQGIGKTVKGGDRRVTIFESSANEKRPPGLARSST